MPPPLPMPESGPLVHIDCPCLCLRLLGVRSSWYLHPPVHCVCHCSLSSLQNNTNDTGPDVPNGAAADAADGGRVLFCSCKGETHNSKQGYKQLFRRLRSSYRPDKLDSKDDFTLDNLKGASVIVFGGPKERFSTQEFEILKKYLKHGGGLMVMLGEGGEERAGTNINYLLEVR